MDVRMKQVTTYGVVWLVNVAELDCMDSKLIIHIAYCKRSNGVLMAASTLLYPIKINEVHITRDESGREECDMGELCLNTGCPLNRVNLAKLGFKSRRDVRSLHGFLEGILTRLMLVDENAVKKLHEMDKGVIEFQSIPVVMLMAWCYDTADSK